MTHPSRPTFDTRRQIQSLARPKAVRALGPIAARFIYSLRLIAMHERVKRDPVPELAARLGRMDIAAKSLSLSQAVAATWPENVRVSCFCHQNLTYDEATIGALIDRASDRDRAGFDAQVDGLIRPDRVHRLWDEALALIAAEMQVA